MFPWLYSQYHKTINCEIEGHSLCKSEHETKLILLRNVLKEQNCFDLHNDNGVANLIVPITVTAATVTCNN